MKKNMIRITLAALALAAIGSAQTVTYNYAAEVDFSKLKSYKWVEIPGGVRLDDITARQLTSALDAELAKKGLSKTDSDTADLFVGYQVAITQQREISSYNSGWGYGPRWGGGMTTATISTLQVGSVALDMYETAPKHLVWRGVATKTIDTGAKPDKRQKNIQKGAEKLLKNYPPKKNK
jgi:hypothetical protein